MDEGIDTGRVIAARWLPSLRFNSHAIQSLNQSDSYRAVFSFLDPWVRAYLLREVIALNDDFWNAPSYSQEEEDGFNFHFMHSKLREVAIKDIFSA